jgi:hypothetical protein
MSSSTHNKNNKTDPAPAGLPPTKLQPTVSDDKKRKIDQVLVIEPNDTIGGQELVDIGHQSLGHVFTCDPTCGLQRGYVKNEGEEVFDSKLREPVKGEVKKMMPRIKAEAIEPYAALLKEVCQELAETRQELDEIKALNFKLRELINSKN